MNVAARVDELENRRLLSSWSVAVESGVLTVNGTINPDRIVLEGVGQQILVTINLTNMSVVERAGLTGIQIYGNDGGDEIVIESSVGGLRTTLLGGRGNDTIRGGNGNDRLVGGRGADVLSGRGGWDTVDYSGQKHALVISIDDQANDGQAKEKDNVRSDIEVVIGGSGNDIIRGSGAANRLYGGAGDDVLHGGNGKDTLDGGTGNDELFGDAGNDVLLGKSREMDSLTGGDGTDRVTADVGLGFWRDDVLAEIEQLNVAKNS